MCACMSHRSIFRMNLRVHASHTGCSEEGKKKGWKIVLPPLHFFFFILLNVWDCWLGFPTTYCTKMRWAESLWHASFNIDSKSFSVFLQLLLSCLLTKPLHVDILFKAGGCVRLWMHSILQTCKKTQASCHKQEVWLKERGWVSVVPLQQAVHLFLLSPEI